MKMIENVSIKFRPGAYKLFRSLQYKTWLALAEYVDNSVQSYLNNKDLLHKITPNYRFCIDITYDKNVIKIWDNAAGINTKDIQRAFEPANIPEDNKGLNEFGMGMKTASIWLSERWSVKTAAIGEEEERQITFDLNTVTEEEREELPVESIGKPKDVHFTEITLIGLTDNAKNKQLDKIKKHIASIHRNLIRSGELELKFNNEILTYEDPNILNAPYYKTDEGETIYWKQDVDYSLGKYSVKGFIGLLETMSTSIDNGFSLFRRGRVIEGSHDDKYRPKSLCGQIGSPQFKRIFGELHLEGFDVSFDKGSFRNKEELDYFLEQLKIELAKNPNNIFLQAQNFRAYRSKNSTEEAVKKTIQSYKKEQAEEYREDKFDDIVKTILSQTTPESLTLVIPEESKIDEITETKEIGGKKYALSIEFVSDKNTPDFYTLQVTGTSPNMQVNCAINLAHPYFLKYENFFDRQDYSTIFQIVKNLIYAELAACTITSNASFVRINFNKFMRNL